MHLCSQLNWEKNQVVLDYSKIEKNKQTHKTIFKLWWRDTSTEFADAVRLPLVLFRVDTVHLSWKLILWPVRGEMKHITAYGKNNRDIFHGKAMMKTYFSEKAG